MYKISSFLSDPFGLSVKGTQIITFTGAGITRCRTQEAAQRQINEPNLALGSG
jgi:hypothetical protein